MINKTLRRLAVGAAAITVAGVVVPLTMAQTASAAEATGVTATPASQSVASGTPATYTANLTPPGATSANGVYFALDQTGLAGTACTPTTVGPPQGGPFTCTVTAAQTTALTLGTHTVTIFDDVTGTTTFQNSDPHTTVSLTVTGAPSNYTVSPSTQPVATNMCAIYTGTAKDSKGNPAIGGTVALTATESSSAAVGNGPAFCSPATATTFGNATPPATKTGVAAPFTYTAAPSSVTAGNDGTFTFGVKSDLTGTVNITVGAPGAGSNPASATLTVNAGTSTGNTQQANNDIAKSITVSPTSQNAFATKASSYTVTVKNATGDVIGGVQPSYIVTAGADKNMTNTCTVSNGAGQSTCSITPSAATTDSITTFVEQDSNPPNNVVGPNAGEPQATSTVTVTAEPAFVAPTHTCASPALTPTAATCSVPASQATEVVTFNFTDNSGPGGTPEPSAGQTVNFTTPLPAPAGVSISPASATTDAKGNVSVTVTHTAGSGQNIPVTATLASDNTITGSVTVAFTAAAASTLTLTPPAQTKAVGSTVTVTASATDQFGAGVSGQTITFSVAGRNGPATNPGATGGCTTAASGTCTFSYTDNGPALTGVATGTDTVSATDTSPGFPPGPPATAQVTFVAGTATASNVALSANSSTANTSPVGIAPTDFVTANVKDALGNNLANDTVTFTSNGVGTFETATGTSLGTSTTVATDGSGNAKVFVNSTAPGTQTVTASADGVTSGPVTITYTSAQFNPITPERLIDSRNGQGGLCSGAPNFFGTCTVAPKGALAPNTIYTLSLANTPAASLPAGTKGIVVNVAAVGPSGVGNLRIAPSNGTVPTTAAITYQPGKDVSNGLVLPYAANYTVYSDSASVNVTVDLEGYYSDGFIQSNAAGANPSPVRVADTRPSQGGAGTIAAGTSRSFQISGVNNDGVPANAKAVALNVSAINPSGLGNLRVYPDGVSTPTTANITYIAHQDHSAFVVVPLPANGKIDVYTDGASVDVAIDAFGYFPSVATTIGATTYQPTNLTYLNTSGTPARALDTRPVAIPANTEYSFVVAGQNGIPANAQAVVVSIAGVHSDNPKSTGVGNLRAYPSGSSTPNAAVLNYVSPTADVANFAIVRIGQGGKITLFSDGSPINAVVDVFAYVPAGS